MSDFEIIIIILLALLVITAIAWLIIAGVRHKTTSVSGQLMHQQLLESLSRQGQHLEQLDDLLQNKINDITRSVDERLNHNQLLTQNMQKTMSERLESAGKTMADLRQQLGQLGQAARNIAEVGSEVKKLQDILQRPGIRGGLGEWTLDNLLSDILPRDYYTLKHRFNNGLVVDALIHLANGKVAVDAKFPLANFELMLKQQEKADRMKTRRIFLRDVCKRIDEIADKYICPEEGTLDFALMFIPAENVYYESIIKLDEKEPDINEYARQRKVIPVSPNTLYAYLMVVATGLRGLQIEKNAQAIRRRLVTLADDMQLFESEFTLLGKHLTNSRNKYEDASRRLSQVQANLKQIEDEPTELLDDSGTPGP